MKHTAPPDGLVKSLVPLVTLMEIIHTSVVGLVMKADVADAEGKRNALELEQSLSNEEEVKKEASL